MMYMNNTKIYKLFIYVVYLQGGENFAIMHGVEQRGLTQKRVEPHFFILFLRSVLLLITLLGKSEPLICFFKGEKTTLAFVAEIDNLSLIFLRQQLMIDLAADTICRKKHHEGERIC